ncbi:hypothetical protein AgCh_017282 [Apium graveolens]
MARYQNLDEQMKNLNMDEEENENMVLSGDIEEEIYKYDLCLVGRFLTEKNINTRPMKSKLKDVWKPTIGINIKELETEIFLFQFFHKEDKAWVMNGETLVGSKDIEGIAEKFGYSSSFTVDKVEASSRQEAWDMLRRLVQDNNLPWCIFGDFNELLFEADKKGLHPHPQHLMNDFRMKRAAVFVAEAENNVDTESSDSELEFDEEDEIRLSEPSENAIYNRDGLLDKLEDISWPENVDCIHKLSVDVNQEQEVKDQLLAEKNRVKEAEERRKARENRKIAKEVEAQKLREKAKQQKEEKRSARQLQKEMQESGLSGSEEDGDIGSADEDRSTFESDPSVGKAKDPTGKGKKEADKMRKNRGTTEIQSMDSEGRKV